MKRSLPPPKSAEPDPLIGQLINGRYRVVSALASGGMGKIYRAEQLPLGRLIALKTLNSRYAGGAATTDPQFQKRFFLEASTLSKVPHPNIVTVFDYGQIEGFQDAYFMAMELLDGETLASRIKRDGALDPVDALAITRQVARGLRETHKHGVVHRDLKPANIVLVPNEDGYEIVKILDFGIAKVLAGDEQPVELTREGVFLGSPRYMAPEQITAGQADARTDVYALGVIFYEMLCGKPPFDAAKPVEILMMHARDPVPPISERNPEVAVPEALELFARACLAKDPAQRPSSMEEVAERLRTFSRTIGLPGAEASTGEHPHDELAGQSSAVRAIGVPSGPLKRESGASLIAVRPRLPVNKAMAPTVDPAPVTAAPEAGSVPAAAAEAPADTKSAAPDPVIAVAPGAESPRRGSRMLAAGVAVIVCVLIGFVATTRAAKHRPADAPAPVASADRHTESAPEVAAGPSPTPVVAAPQASMVSVQTTPPGAAVHDGNSGELLCPTTPCVLPVVRSRRVTLTLGSMSLEAVLDPSIANASIPFPAAAPVVEPRGIAARGQPTNPALRARNAPVANPRARPTPAPGHPASAIPMFGTGHGEDSNLPMFGTSP